MTLKYQSKQYGNLMMDTQGVRKLNGQHIDLNYKTYDCPYLQSKWDSGIVHILKDDRSMTLDFNRGTRAFNMVK